MQILSHAFNSVYVHDCIEGVLGGYFTIFGKCAYLLSLPVLDEKINITLMPVCKVQSWGQNVTSMADLKA